MKQKSIEPPASYTSSLGRSFFSAMMSIGSASGKYQSRNWRLSDVNIDKEAKVEAKCGTVIELEAT